MVAALALSGIGTASASASTLTLASPWFGPIANANFIASGPMVYGYSGAAFECQKFDLQTEITQNEADPVTLESTGVSLGPCETGQHFKLEFSDIETTSPMTLRPDGTGTLPIRLTEHAEWKGPDCDRSGTLKLTEYGGGVIGYNGDLAVTEGYCGWAIPITLNGSFNVPTDETGEPIEFVVTP
jgi:hypothetical protein